MERDTKGGSLGRSKSTSSVSYGPYVYEFCVFFFETYKYVHLGTARREHLVPVCLPRTLISICTIQTQIQWQTTYAPLRTNSE